MIKQIATTVYHTDKYQYMHEAWDDYICKLSATLGAVKSSDLENGTHLNTWYGTVKVRGMVQSFRITKQYADVVTFTIATLDYILD